MIARFMFFYKPGVTGVCKGTVLSCTGGACSRGYRRGERGREAPKSLLEEKSIEASDNIGCSVVLSVTMIANVESDHPP